MGDLSIKLGGYNTMNNALWIMFVGSCSYKINFYTDAGYIQQSRKY